MKSEVFKQASGWMEGWKYDHVDAFSQNPFHKQRYHFINHAGQVYLLTLSDILFDTDFCPRFFPSECTLPSFECCAEDFTWRSHKKVLAFMSHGERIAFLEKHLEVEEDSFCSCPCRQNGITLPIGNHACEHGCGILLDEPCEKTEHFNKEGVDIVLKPCNKNGCMVLHTEKNDDRQIEGISEVHIDRINGVDHFSLQTRKDIIVTINQLVKVANAHQKELDNLKLNQGGH